MGATSSSLSELHTNEYLKRISSTDIISANEPFWNQLLSFTFNPPTNSADSKLLEEQTASILKNLSVNNPQTGNFGNLIQVFMMRSSHLNEISGEQENNDNIFLRQTYNALFMIRSASKYFIENQSEELVQEQFSSVTEGEGSHSEGPLADELIKDLVKLIIDTPLSDATYGICLEAVNTLLVLLSSQMYREMSAESLNFYKYVLRGKCVIHAGMLIKKLLENFIRQDATPEVVTGHSKGNSMLYDATSALASGFFKVVTLGYAGQKAPSHEPLRLLANQSLLLVLVLANHCANSRDFKNPFREALFSCADAAGTEIPEGNVIFRIDFTNLYTALCSTLHQDHSTLLLYLLMHRNTNFRLFTMKRTDYEKATLPILQILYHSPENSHQIYMALIVLLMFTEDDHFNRSIQSVTLKQVNWFTERPLSEVTLGSLLALILTRTIQHNLQHLRDKYLHTNCLAALANMSSRFAHFHTYVSQRILSLVHLLAKRHSKVIEKIREAAAASKGDSEVNEVEQEYLQDLSTLEEVIRMLLEIINSVLTHCPSNNPHFIYTLLYQKDTFSSFRTHPSFRDVMQNIDVAVSYFTDKLEQECGRDPTEHAVMQMIRSNAGYLNKMHNLRKFSELKFKYVEEESPDEFFIPYIWSLVYQKSTLYFNASRIKLFNFQLPVA